MSNSEIITIECPENLRKVKKCADCKIGFSALLNGSAVCLRPILDKDGNFEGFDILCCKHNKEQKIRMVLE